MKGGKKVEEETKKPCTPVEEAGGDYNELGLYLHSKENNRTLEAAQTLWEFLPGWMAARKMAVYDPDYNRSLSGVIAENAEIILKAAQDMAGWTKRFSVELSLEGFDRGAFLFLSMVSSEMLK